MISIYRASAGAGKTHKLTGEYIKLLFDKPYAYKHILAVTFTNKATDEMKQRILKELYNLASWERESGYLPELMAIFGKGEKWVREEASRILVAILHDYSSFSISTIDKFFQMVMRAFAREMGKIATYNVELDRDGVLANAIDRMFSELDKPENDSLLKWLIDYSLEAVDAGNSWNVRRDIFELARELFSEDFKLKSREVERGTGILPENAENLSGREAIVVLKRKIKEVTERFEHDLRVLGKEGVTCMAKCGTGYADFKGGSRSPLKYFNVLSEMPLEGKVVPPTATFIGLYDNQKNWYSGKNIPGAVAAAYEGGLNECVGKILVLFERRYKSYATASVIEGNMNALGILDDIYRRVLAYCKEKNVMLLSESTELLNRIIDGSDTPFVYEKIGTRIDHFMLDEFQDTSILQWRNFYPLLQNSLADGNENLIVGDVKQSIYRWRGSDWNILNSGLFADFRADEINSYSLDCNWRSGKNIVDFNNSFFKFCAQQAQLVYDGKSVGKDGAGMIAGIYSGFEQTVPKKSEEHPGYLEVNFIEPSEDKFETDVLSQLAVRVQDLLCNGAAQKDIAVLVRKKDQGREVARTLIDAGLDVISNDSLFVCSSFAVQKVVNILREIENPENPALKIYRHFSSRQAEETEPDAVFLQRIASLALYEMCEEIIRTCLLETEREELAFLQSFLDSVLEYTNKEGTSVGQFLKWWDESGQLKTISAPEDQDAIHVMTIHKSKGLGFKIVLIPFLKEGFDRPGGRLWCNLSAKEDAEQEDELVFEAPIPVVYNTALAETVFDADYDREKLCTFVDNLNTAYVAFTRPKEQLIIYSSVPKLNKDGEYKIASVADVLYLYYENEPEECTVSKIGERTKRVTAGNPEVTENKLDTSEREVLTAAFSTLPDSSRLKTSLSSGSVNEETSIREYGIAMHAVFSYIRIASDVPEASHRAFEEGVCSCSAEELSRMVVHKLQSVAEYGWFDVENKVLNECDIIKTDGNVVRPDRVIIRSDGSVVVVDYKFGEHDQASDMERRYVNQVKGYKRLLESIGYERCEGYLWYVEEELVINC